MQRGVADQLPLSHRNRVKLHRLDLTGVSDELNRFRWTPQHDVARVLADIESHVLPLPVGEFAAVLSAGVLSQLNMHVVSCVGERHSHFVSLLQAIRRAHINQMAIALQSGGTGLIVVDAVSSATLPSLLNDQIVGSSLRSELSAAIESNNFFHGMNPFAILGAVEQDSRCHGAVVPEPWRWTIGHLTYGTTAVIFSRM